MSDSVRPHRRQPTRLPHPWDSPGKNSGVGCHFLLQCMKVKSESEVAQSCLTPSDPMDCGPPDSSVHGIFQARVLEWGAIVCKAENNKCLKHRDKLYWEFRGPYHSLNMLIKEKLMAVRAFGMGFERYQDCMLLWRKCFQGGSVVKIMPAMQETRVRSLGQEDALEKEMATCFSILTWKIPRTEEPGGLQFTGLWKRYDWATIQKHENVAVTAIISVYF